MGTSQTSFSPAGTLPGALHPSLECIQPLQEKGFKLDWWSATEPTSAHTLSDTRTLSSLNDFKALRESVTHQASSDSLGCLFPSPSGTSGQEGVRGEMKTDFTINLPHLKRSRYPKAPSLGVHNGDSRLGGAGRKL